MAVMQHADVSDDDFDIIEPAQPVSEPSSPNYRDAAAHPHHANIDTTNNTKDSRQFPDGLKPLEPMPLEAAHAGTEQTDDPRQPSSLPMFPPQPFVQDKTHDDALAPLPSQVGDEGRTLSPNNHTATQPRSGDGGGDGDGIPGLKYTKSVYQKFWGGKEALIAVMGMTGSGKTTFISKVTGRTDLNIGHSLTSCTRDIEVIETKINGQTVRLVDTPGFSDTHMSDTEVLQLIADYLAAAYKEKMQLSGIIYLHPISDTRVTHHATKNLQMFQKLTGEKNLKNVVLATSMWDKVTEDVGAARETELKDKFWKLLLAFKAKTQRYDGTAAGAQQLCAGVLENKPFYLQLQEEMGKDNKALRDTAAGREVVAELARLRVEHRREVAEMEALMRSSAEESRAVVEALNDHYQQKLREVQKNLQDERLMNEEAVRTLNERILALEGRGRCQVM